MSRKTFPETEPRNKDEGSLRTPYGPQFGKTDEAAGGADSSPFDNLSSDERQAEAEKIQHTNQDAGKQIKT